MSDEKIGYLDVIKKSWQITWHNRFLWWFGFFLALGGGGFNFNLPLGGENNGKQEEMVTTAQNFIARYWQWFVVGIAFLIVFFLVLLVLKVISQAGMVKAVSAINLGKSTTFKESFREGKRYFWKILLLGLLLTFFILGIVVVLFTPVMFLVFFKSYVWALILGILAILIALVLAIVISYLRRYAIIYLVLSNLSIRDSLENAYLLFRKNILPSLIFSLLLLVTGIIVGFGIIIFLFMLVILFILPAVISYLLLQKIGVIVVVILGAFVAAAFVIFVQSVFQTFLQTSWVLFFKEIASVKTEETVTEEETVKNPAKILDVGEA